MNSKVQLLSDILDLTREMREKALESRWELVQEIEARRHPLMEACFPLDDLLARQAGVAEWIGEIIELDRSVLSMAAIAREDLGRILSRISQGKQASDAYQRVEYGG